MTSLTLTVLDTTGIQEYLFGTNPLREQVGASQLVESALAEWLYSALHQTGCAHNLTGLDGRITRDDPARPLRLIERATGDAAEVIYRGGGNALILFTGLALAQAVVGALSRGLLRVAPGLELAAAHQAFDWEQEPIGGPMGAQSLVMHRLSAAKQQRGRGAPLQGLAVTCASPGTGLPAVDVTVDPDNAIREISAELRAKLDDRVQRAASERLKTLLGNNRNNIWARYTLSERFDELGRSSGEQSELAIVHADGNRMGDRFERLAAAYPDPGAGNRAYIHALRGLSEAVNEAGSRALAETVLDLTRALDGALAEANAAVDPATLSPLGRFAHGLTRRENGQDVWLPVLPVRPIVFGGDDVTFVCDGRLGLALATAYLRQFETQATSQLQALHERGIRGVNPADDQPSAAAGVAIVKTHYPFFRAYRLAEELTRSAKEAAKLEAAKLEARERGSQGVPSALDWERVVQTGVVDSLEAIRAAGYAVPAGTLSMRPVTLERPGFDGWRSWPNFEAMVTELERPKWQRRQTQLQALRVELRSGAPAVTRYRLARHLPKLPEVAGARGAEESGWHQAPGRAVHFDAVDSVGSLLWLDTPVRTPKEVTR